MTTVTLNDTLIGWNTLKQNTFRNDALLNVSAVNCTDGFLREGMTYTINSEEKTVTLTRCDREDAEIWIPDTVEGYPVTVIGGNAFNNDSTLTSVRIPVSVTTIEANAFNACLNLEAVDYSDGYTCRRYQMDIGSNEELLSQWVIWTYRQATPGYTLPQSLQRLDAAAMQGTPATVVAVPSGVTFIAEDALGNAVTLIVTDQAETVITDWCDAHDLQWTVQADIYSIP